MSAPAGGAGSVDTHKYMKGVCVGYVNVSCIGAHLRVVPQLVLDEAQQVLLVHAGGVVHVRVHLWEGEGRGKRESVSGRPVSWSVHDRVGHNSFGVATKDSKTSPPLSPPAAPKEKRGALHRGARMSRI